MDATYHPYKQYLSLKDADFNPNIPASDLNDIVTFVLQYWKKYDYAVNNNFGQLLRIVLDHMSNFPYTKITLLKNDDYIIYALINKLLYSRNPHLSFLISGHIDMITRYDINSLKQEDVDTVVSNSTTKVSTGTELPAEMPVAKKAHIQPSLNADIQFINNMLNTPGKLLSMHSMANRYGNRTCRANDQVIAIRTRIISEIKRIWDKYPNFSYWDDHKIYEAIEDRICDLNLTRIQGEIFYLFKLILTSRRILVETNIYNKLKAEREGKFKVSFIEALTKKYSIVATEL